MAVANRHPYRRCSGRCPLADPLEILGGLQRDDRDAVGDGEQRHLRAIEEFLDHHGRVTPAVEAGDRA